MWFPWFKKLRQDSHDTQEMLKQQEAAIRDTAQAWEQKQSEVGTTIARAIKAASDSTANYEQPQRKKEHSLQWGIFWVTLWAAVAATGAAVGAGIYAHIAGHQLDTMNKTYGEIQAQTTAAQCTAKAAQAQATLMRQQLEGTMAAVLKINMGVGTDRQTVDVALMNVGHVIAKNVRVQLKAVKRTLPGEKQIGHATPINYTIPEIGLTQDMWQQRQYPIHLSAGDADAIRSMKETVRLEGRIIYFNGFSDTTVPVCYGVLEFERRDRAGRVLLSGNNPQVPCDELDIFVANELEQQKQASEK